jgi:[protein-PII] uridylyltransferase
MKLDSTHLQRLRQQHTQQAAEMRAAFQRTGDGVAAVRLRTTQTEALLRQLWQEFTGGPGSQTSPAIAIVATGGFGRRELFPCSDVDVLFLCAQDSVERDYHDTIRAMTQAMWDVGLRASPATRTYKECDRVDPNNLEFTVSLLERRFLTGDQALYTRFETELLPATILRESGLLLENICEMATARHAKYGHTIFHLEPNLKECPGGLRDHNLTEWLLLLGQLQATRAWPSSVPAPMAQDDYEAAFDFLAAARCFLHYRSNRDNNTLDWHAQDEAAAASIGLETAGSADPAYWMRTYYRHARTVYRRACLLMDNLPRERRLLLKPLRRRRSPIADTGFFVEEGRILLGDSVLLTDADAILRVFVNAAHHGHRFSQDAEARISDALPALAMQMPEGPFLWNCLRDVLLAPFAAHALRTMHALGLLELILPEFHGIDSLVIRDAYHRYTVDEHTFLVIENVHLLRQPRHEFEKRFSTLLPEIERPDLFFLALLLHDTGKGRRFGDHAAQSVQLAERVFARLEFDPEERELIRRLIRNHLEMSLAMRRDIFDPESIRLFAEHTPSQQQLKMLTLLTYADVKAVNPDALTPWKAENLWQLYIATSSFLDRSVDEARYHVESDSGLLSRILALVPDRQDELRSYLEGLPQRYLQTRLPEQIRQHFELALALENDPGARGSIQLAFRTLRQYSEVTLVAHDRPLLFADMAGALSAWGMNIVKADAFSNSAGIILDSFQFSDPFRTLELNPGETDRFLASIGDALSGRSSLDRMLQARRNARHEARRRGVFRAEAGKQLQFDEKSSDHSTLLQVVARDFPGLLREIAVVIAGCGCDIQVALVDTEGDMAIDVFYLTAAGGKLDDKKQRCLAEKVEAALAER